MFVFVSTVNDVPGGDVVVLPAVSPPILYTRRERVDCNLRVLLDPVKLAARNLSPDGLVPMLQQANRQFRAGGLTTGNREVLVETGAFLKTADDVGSVVVGVFSGRPVYLREIAEIVDGGEEPGQYVFHGTRAGDVD